jgi:hypothetical protein
MEVILKIRAFSNIERIEAMIYELNKGIANDFNDVVESVKTSLDILEEGDN